MASVCREPLPGEALRAVEARQNPVKAGTQACPLWRSDAVSQVRVLVPKGQVSLGALSRQKSDTPSPKQRVSLEGFISHESSGHVEHQQIY